MRKSLLILSIFVLLIGCSRHSTEVFNRGYLSQGDRSPVAYVLTSLGASVGELEKSGYHVHEIEYFPKNGLQLWCSLFYLFNVTGLESVSAGEHSIYTIWPNNDEHHHKETVGLPDGFSAPGSDMGTTDAPMYIPPGTTHAIRFPGLTFPGSGWDEELASPPAWAKWDLHPAPPPKVSKGYHVHVIQTVNREALHRVWCALYWMFDNTAMCRVSTDGKSIFIVWPDSDKHHHKHYVGLPDSYWWPGRQWYPRAPYYKYEYYEEPLHEKEP